MNSGVLVINLTMVRLPAQDLFERIQNTTKIELSVFDCPDFRFSIPLLGKL